MWALPVVWIVLSQLLAYLALSQPSNLIYTGKQPTLNKFQPPPNYPILCYSFSVLEIIKVYFFNICSYLLSFFFIAM
jgi:hypothetical protein